MKKLAICIIATMLYSISLEAAPRDLIVNDTIINDQLIERQALVLEIVQSYAPIQTVEDVQLHLDNPKSPINKLSLAARDRFVESIVYTENGVGGFSYLPLLELPKGDIYQIAKLFGLQFELPILDRGTFDKGDKNTFSILCDGDTDCLGGDLYDAVCVESSDGSRSCRQLGGHVCSSNCPTN